MLDRAGQLLHGGDLVEVLQGLGDLLLRCGDLVRAVPAGRRDRGGA
jgi:hypothetical protein